MQKKNEETAGTTLPATTAPKEVSAETAADQAAQTNPICADFKCPSDADI